MFTPDPPPNPRSAATGHTPLHSPTPLSAESNPTARKAFTLIELLVVISIIALLIGILLPALSAARKSSQSAVCLGNERSLGQAVAAYVTDERNHLPGPNTSGAYLWQRHTYQFTRANEPVQSWDWISPTLGNAIGFPDDPVARYRAIFETEFKCPANDLFYDAQYVGPPIGIDPTTLPVSSYTSSIGFHNSGQSREYYLPWPVSAALNISENLGSKLDAMGPPSIKMWAMDGSRYVTPQGIINFDTQIKGNPHGANFMTRSPALATSASSGSPHRVDRSRQLVEASKRTGFRHNEKMNGVFLDGHADSFDNEASRPPEYYFPTGSAIRAPRFFVATVPGRTNLR